MEKKKKILVIGGSAGAAALVALIVVSIVLANRPSALIIRGFANTLADAERIELIDVADDVANGGSIAVSANLDKVAKDDVAVQAKIYTDAKDLRGAYEMTVTEDKDTVLQANVIYNQDKVTFKCLEVVDGIYGINFKNLRKNLPGSIFDPDEETDYSLDDEEFEYFMGLNETIKNNKNLQRDSETILAKYRQLAIEKLVKYSEPARSSKTITVGGEKIPCTVISLAVDQDDLALATQDLIDYANNDKELEKYLYRLASNAAFEGDKDEFVDNFYDFLDDIEDEIDRLEDSDIGIRLDFYITKAGRRIARIDADFELNRDEAEISLVLGKNVSTSKEMSLTLKDKANGDSISIAYTVSENSSKIYDAELKIKETSVRSSYNRDRTTTFKIEWDKRGGDFSFKYKDNYSDMSIKGTLIQKGDKYVFVLTNIRIDGETTPIVKALELTVTIDRHDPAPNVPASFTEVTTMDKRDFKHLIEDIDDGFTEIWDKYFD